MSYFEKIETDGFIITLYDEKRAGGNSGSFEHKVLGEDFGGGLWINHSMTFEQSLNLTEGDPTHELYDYDGVYDLPEEVAMALECRGIYLH